jgi:lysine biosynthesis protein LysW
VPYAVCPACDEEFSVRGNPTLGQRIECPECRAKLEVVYRNPLELDFAFDDEEDLDEDDELEDEAE